MRDTEDSGRRLVMRAAISASHEIYASGEAAVEAAVARRIADRTALREKQHRPGRGPVERTPLLRSIEGGVDDSKFLYPVLDNLPLVVFPLLSYALTGVQVSVYGSPEVCRVVEVVRERLLADGLIDDAGRIVTAEEDRSAISIWQSFRLSTEALGAPRGEVVLWSAGDLVLAYDTYRWLLDPDAGSHELILDLSARQVVFPPGTPELFARGYFDSLRREDGRAVDVKEPNVLLFNANGLRGLALVNELRHPPEGETYVSVLLRAARRTLLRASPAASLAVLRYGWKRTRGTLETRDGLPQRHAAALAGAFFGVPTRVKADNGDPFSVKDCDSLEDLFGYYRTLLQPIVDSGRTREEGYRELARYYPYADVLYRLSGDLLPLRGEIPLWRSWPEVLQDRISACNRRLREELNARGLDGGGEPPVPEYFDSAGAFRPIPVPTDDIPATRRFLRGAYRAGFEEGRARFQRLAFPSHRETTGSGGPPWRSASRF